MVLALTATVNGLDGFLWLIACLLFLVAAVIAWVAGRNYWGILVAAGLCLAALSRLVH